MSWLFLLIAGAALLGATFIPQVKRALPFNVLPARISGVLLIALGVGLTSIVSVPKENVGLLYQKFGGVSNTTGNIAADGENGRQARILSEGMNFKAFVNVINDVTTVPTVKIADGQMGLLTAKDGLPLPAGEYIAPDWVTVAEERIAEERGVDPSEINLESKRDSIEKAMLDATNFLTYGGQKGPQLNVLRPGEHKINTYLFDVELVNATEVKPGFVGVVVSKVGKVPTNIERSVEGQTLAQPVVPKGTRGIWKETLTPSTYYMNTEAYTIYHYPTLVQTWKYAGKYHAAEIDLSVNDKGEITQTRKEFDVPEDKQAADHAMGTKTKDGWEVHVNCRLLVQVDAEDAPYILSSIGDLQKLEDKIITPLIRSQVRNQGESVDATEFVTRRTEIEQEIEQVVIAEAKKIRVDVKEFRMTSTAIPPELLVPDKRKQLATKLQNTYNEEKKAFQAKVASDKAKAEAEQQGELVRAQIAKEAAKENKEAKRLQGEGEKLYMQQIAEGQEAMVNVYGKERSFKLKTLEELKEMAKESPEALAAPQIYTVNSGRGTETNTDLPSTFGLGIVNANKTLKILQDSEIEKSVPDTLKAVTPKN